MLERMQKGGELMTEKVNFELGEKKYVCISVRSTCKKPFDVTSAKYVLRNGDQIEKSGECEISKWNDTGYHPVCADPANDQRRDLHARVYIRDTA